MTRRPCAPTTIKAILAVSLGGMKPSPPKTWRGTMEKAMAAPALCSKNLRRPTLLMGVVLVARVVCIVYLEQRGGYHLRGFERKVRQRASGFRALFPFFRLLFPWVIPWRVIPEGPFSRPRKRGICDLWLEWRSL